MAKNIADGYEYDRAILAYRTERTPQNFAAREAAQIAYYAALAAEEESETSVSPG